MFEGAGRADFVNILFYKYLCYFLPGFIKLVDFQHPQKKLKKSNFFLALPLRLDYYYNKVE